MSNHTICFFIVSSANVISLNPFSVVHGLSIKLYFQIIDILNIVVLNDHNVSVVTVSRSFLVVNVFKIFIFI